MLRTAAAIPSGSRRSHSPGRWLAAVRTHPDTAALRADAHRNLSAVAWALARYTDWHTLHARPGWPLLCECTGLGRRTVARWLAWLRARGLLGLVETGSTPTFRPGVIDDGRGDLAAEYLLTQPQVSPADDEPVHENGTPSNFRKEVKNPPHARETAHQGPNTETGTQPAWTPTSATKKDRRAAERTTAAQTQTRIHPLRRISPTHVAWLVRPYLTRGWTIEDLAYALDHDPDGQPWTQTTEVRHPAGWYQHRMSAWRDSNGIPLPPRSAQLAAQAQHHREAQTTWRAGRDHAQAHAVDPDTAHTHAQHCRRLVLTAYHTRRGAG